MFYIIYRWLNRWIDRSQIGEHDDDSKTSLVALKIKSLMSYGSIRTFIETV